MIKPSKSMLQTALTNNTFDIDMTDKTLRSAQDNSFGYLYRLQRNIVGYEEYFYTTFNNENTPDFGDLYLDSKNRVCINFPVDLIVSTKREKYRYSKYHRQEITIDELREDINLFQKLPIITIDNQILRTFKVRLYDGHFVAILPFSNNFLYEKYMNEEKKHYEYKTHNIKLQIITNSRIYDMTINKYMLQEQSANKTDYNRLQMEYITRSIGRSIDNGLEGMYFITIYDGNNVLGTQLQEITYDEIYVNIALDNDAIELINNSTQDLTIRFIFFKYLHKHMAYNNSYVKSRLFAGSSTSELFLIQDREAIQYDMPIPTENLFIYRFKTNEMVYDIPQSKELISNATAEIKYPNIYRINAESPSDGYNIYYFYQKGYDLHYKYLYGFFMRYLYYKWGENKNRTLEQIINSLYFGDINIEGEEGIIIDPDELVDYVVSRYLVLMVNDGILSENNVGSFYQYIMDNVTLTQGIDSSVYNAYLNSSYLQNEQQLPLAISQFNTVFDYVINHGFLNYNYGDVDYTTNYSGSLSPIEYKVSKLKEFIKDDFNILHNYVKNQNQVSIKYNFFIKDMNLEKRYRTKPDNSSSTFEFTEPMYLFTFDNSNRKNYLICRIYIDGLLCTNFHIESFTYTNYVYIPVSKFIDAKFVEIEIYPSYHDAKLINFNDMNEYIDLSFEADDQIYPTISDLYFETKDGTAIDNAYFDFKLISDNYSYNYSKDVDAYRTSDHSGYYVLDGQVYEYYDENGIRDINKDIGKNELPSLQINGTIEYQPVKITVWDNELDIVRDTNYIGFSDVCDGSSTINKDNIGIYATKITRPKDFSKNMIVYFINDASGDYYTATGIYHRANGEIETSLNILSTALQKKILDRDVIKGEIKNNLKIRIRLTTTKYYGVDIYARIDKESIFKYDTLEYANYPAVELPLDNVNCDWEYMRAFRDGRLISKNQYEPIFIDGEHHIQYFQRIEAGHEIAVDLTPYRNRLVYYNPELTSDIVDLKDYINKPFDIQYYDVYLNGRRLSRNNIFPFSPYSFKLAGTHSIYNFEVYEKDRDWEYYGCDFSDYFTLQDLIKQTFIESSISDKIIHDITGDLDPNDNTERKEEYERELTIETLYFEIFYYNELLPLGITDPDISQFNADAVKKRYPIVWDMYSTINDKEETVLFLNPDIIHEGGDFTKDRVYTMWNDDEFMETLK